jgi:hypothetical protein
MDHGRQASDYVTSRETYLLLNSGKLGNKQECQDEGMKLNMTLQDRGRRRARAIQHCKFKGEQT